MATALDWLARGVADGPLGLGLLPPDFRDDDVRAVHRAVFGSARSALPWRRRMERAGRIAPATDAKDLYRLL
jgi:hypothetical protein